MLHVQEENNLPLLRLPMGSPTILGDASAHIGSYTHICNTHIHQNMTVYTLTSFELYL